jgi:hypothetical protein
LSPGNNGILVCEISGESYTHTGRLELVKELWRKWAAVDSKLRQIEPVSEADIDQLEVDVDRFGLLFKEIYGNANVTAYIHMTCCHAVPMLRNQPCKSLGIHANQGAEAAHKSIRQLLNFTARGGGKWQKDVPLAVLERHYRILMLGTVFGADDLLDSALDVNECEVQLENKQQEKMYALGGRFAQVLEWVGEKTQNQSAEMFLCKRYTAPNTVYAVARQKRRKIAYQKPRELSNMDTDDANDAHPLPHNGHTSDTDSSGDWNSEESS